MSTMPPPVQPQTFAQIISEALVRIPVHNPEYTNYQNNTDPGVTILQLFAFMVDNLSYLCNQVPDQNRLKFLSLLGIPMQPPQAASGMVTFSNTRGPLQTVTLAAQLPVFAGATGFVTSDGLDVLPVEAMIFMRAKLSAADQSQRSANLHSALRCLHHPHDGTAVLPDRNLRSARFGGQLAGGDSERRQHRRSALCGLRC